MRTPILSANTLKKSLVNVEPLFKLDATFSYSEAAEIVDNAIETIITEHNPEFPLGNHKELLTNLFLIRDMFKEITEQRILTDKKTDK